MGAGGRRLLMVAVVGLAAAGLIGSLLYLALTFDDSGSDDPTAAARRLFAAVEAGDAAGAFAAVSPGERDLVRDYGDDLLTELDRLGLLTAFAPSSVPGLHTDVGALAFTTEELGDQMVAVDVVGGRMTSEVDDEVPVAPSGRELLDDAFGVEIEPGSATRDFAQDPLRIVAVDEGGRWYVSVAYTVAELLRGAPEGHRPAAAYDPRAATEPGPTTTVPVPDFDVPVTPTGAESPATAVRQYVAALAAGDLDRVVDLTDAAEAPLLAAYLPVLLAAEGEEASATVDSLELTTSGDGPRTLVQVEELSVDVTGSVQSEQIHYDGDCYEAAYRFGDREPYVRFERCNGEEPPATDTGAGASDDEEAREREEEREAEARRSTSEQEGGTEVRTGEAPPPDNLLSSLAVFGGGIDLPTFSVVEHDGAFFVSPTRTLLGSAVATLEGLAPDDVDGIADRLERSVGGDRDDDLTRESRDPDNALFGPAASTEQPLIARCFTAILETVGEYGVGAYGPACLRNLVETGAAEPDAVEGIVLFDECLGATHSGPPDPGPPVRRFFLGELAVRSCLERHVDAGDAPPEILARLNEPEDQPCFEPYRDLAVADPEAAWATADVSAQACFDELLDQ